MIFKGKMLIAKVSDFTLGKVNHSLVFGKVRTEYQVRLYIDMIKCFNKKMIFLQSELIYFTLCEMRHPVCAAIL